MALTLAPFVLTDVVLTLALKTPPGTPVAYECQLNRAELVPGGGGGGGTQTYDTFCNTFTSGATSSSWTLELSGFQAFMDVTDLSLFLFDNEGQVGTYSLTPAAGAISATNPGFTGDVTLVATNIGGTANQYATFTVSLPCAGKPVKDVTVVGTSRQSEQEAFA